MGWEDCGCPVCGPTEGATALPGATKNHWLKVLKGPLGLIGGTAVPFRRRSCVLSVFSEGGDFASGGDQ